MALIDLGRISDSATGFSHLPASKQIFILLAVSISVALGAYVAFWTQNPNLIPLYAHLDSKEVHQVLDSLQKNNIEHKFDNKSGILVPMSKVHEIRMKLASEGLPKGSGYGYELLDQAQSFGTSQFMENIRYRRSLEGELSKTIGSLDVVRVARVHLGLPRQSSFLKRNTASSASVMLDLVGGQEISTGQVMGIVHLVSSSVAGLKREDITVVDQRGNLLTSNNSSAVAQAAMEELGYAKQKEHELSRKIQDILSPLYGVNAVKAQVAIQFDFTKMDITRENFDRNNPSIRSESVVMEQKNSDAMPAGVPGALSNQPPSIAEAPEVVEEVVAEGEEMQQQGNMNYRNHATRNYELNKTITYEKHSAGKILKLSVAVVINDKVRYGDSGEPSYTPLSEDELSKAESLVKDAVGFNAERGDTVSVVNSQFAAYPPITNQAASPFSDPMQLIQEPWVISIIKQVLGGLFLLFLVFTVLKPMMKVLINLKPVDGSENEQAEDKKESEEVSTLELPSSDVTSKARIEHVKKIAHEDSKKAAQVVMNWVGAEDE